MREVEDKLMRFIPKEFLMDAHHWLILHGRYTCKALKPQCQTCIINDLCEYPAKPDRRRRFKMKRLKIRTDVVEFQPMPSEADKMRFRRH